MQKIKALLENTETQTMLEENKEVVNEATQVMGQFLNILNNYISENLVEFLDENLEETARNIYTFSTFATKQMLSETTAVYGRSVHQAEVLKEAAKTEFV